MTQGRGLGRAMGTDGDGRMVVGPLPVRTGEAQLPGRGLGTAHTTGGKTLPGEAPGPPPRHRVDATEICISDAMMTLSRHRMDSCVGNFNGTWEEPPRR